jgi:uncharacterized protein
MRLRIFAAASLVTACLTLPAPGGQGVGAVEKMSLTLAQPFYPRDNVVTGELRIPASKGGRVPAVLILHGSAGIDGRGAFYAEALNAAGIATLEIDMFQGRGRPPTTRANMPHAFESLRWLARDPRIDGARVGVMGFSWGGVMSVFSSSEEIARQYGSAARFAAHLALYPPCWPFRSVLEGKQEHYRAAVLRSLTGRPVHILAGGKDDYDSPGNCERLMAALDSPARDYVALTIYPGATHIWDGRAGGSFHDSAAHDGKGGVVNVVVEPELAKKSRAFAVEFFSTHLGVR